MKSFACLIACIVAVAGGISRARAETHSDSTAAVRDTVVAGRVLDLDRVIQRVLERNTTLAAARAAWSAAKARAQQSGALDNPMLDVMAAPRSFGSSTVPTAYRVGITQSFPLFGQRGDRRQAVNADARAAGWDLRAAQLDLVREARVAFVDYWRIGRAIAVNQELLRLLPELRRVTLAKYAAGLVGQQDPLQVDGELAMLDHRAVILERQRRVTAATLNVLMHQPADASMPPPPPDLPLPDTTMSHSELASHARALRPELRAADARVDAARARLALAGRERLPETGFSVAYDRFWAEPELRTTVGVTFNLPVNFGRLSDARGEANAELQASEARSEAMSDSIELQVAVAMARLHEQAHDVDIAQNRMLPLSERTLRAARASYEANRTDFLTLLNSLRDFLRTHLEADESLAMLHVARADLDRALGNLPAGLEHEVQP